MTLAIQAALSRDILRLIPDNVLADSSAMQAIADICDLHADELTSQEEKGEQELEETINQLNQIRFEHETFDEKIRFARDIIFCVLRGEPESVWRKDALDFMNDKALLALLDEQPEQF